MKSIIIGLIFALAFSIIFNLYSYQKFAVTSAKDAAYWKQQAFKVDTTFTHEHYIYPALPPAAENMPPKTVEIFDKPTPESQHASVGFDTLGMISLYDSIARARTPIDRLYLTQFPKANKLINGQFGHDSVNLTMLSIDGLIKTEKYPVDLSLYKYDFRNNLMNATELSASEKKKYTQKKSNLYNGTYIDYQRDFINKANAVRATSGINVWKLRVQGFAEQPLNIPVNGTKQFQAGASVGFRLF
jgi:hypothetical protein